MPPAATPATGTHEPPASPPATDGRARAVRHRRRRILAGFISLLVIAAVFGFGLPRYASYGAVWASLSAIQWPGLAAIGAAVVASQFTTWWMITSVLPPLRMKQAAAVNLASSAVANTVPAGGALAMGVSWAMMSGWAVTGSQYVQYTLVSGLWNVFARLGLPVAALAIVAMSGHASTAWLAGAGLGAAALVIIVAGLTALLRSESVASRADRALHRGLSLVSGLVRRGRPAGRTGMVLRWRAGTTELLARRWPRITAATLASHLTLWLVLLACLRASGLTQAVVSWPASLAAFAFVRLLSVVPITPGGLGVIELGLTGSLAAGLGPVLAARVAGAVLLYRAVTFLLPLPAGAGAYLWWRRHRRPVTAQ